MASAGLYASLHLAPDRYPCQHPTTQFFTGWMPFLPPNQQRKSTEGYLQLCWYISTFGYVLKCTWIVKRPRLMASGRRRRSRTIMTTSLRLQSHLLRSAVALQLLPCDIILHVTSTGLSVTGKYVCSLLLKFIIMIVCHSFLKLCLLYIGCCKVSSRDFGACQFWFCSFVAVCNKLVAHFSLLMDV